MDCCADAGDRTPVAGVQSLFTDARTANAFTDAPVPPALLRQLYELVKWGPTSGNCCPARFLFVHSAAAKERLLPCMSRGNREKTRQAPVTVIVGMDLAFHDRLPQLFPHADARAWFTGNDALIHETALRNSSLQGAYLIMAARMLGLDCGPMSGFNQSAVDAEFWAGTAVVTNFICNLGVADHGATRERLPRLAFEEACSIV